MKNQRCLYCYELLEKQAVDFHEKCSMDFFGTPVPPILPYSLAQMAALAGKTVSNRISVPGVQPKLSLEIQIQKDDPKNSRLTIVGLWGHYILKPPAALFPSLPENEDLSMHLARMFGITTAAHSLIKLKSGELAYITKRFDRDGEQKLAMEDMCQLTETLTANKYRSSMEKIGKKIWEYSSRPGLDASRFFEVVIFSFLTGNADMHLKNFSLLTSKENDILLSPAYDLLCTPVAMPEDKEEMALTINGKKNKLEAVDFANFSVALKLSPKLLWNTYNRFAGMLDKATDLTDKSFLPPAQKKAYINILLKRAARLGLDNQFKQWPGGPSKQ